jgi:hypothetical protein
MKMFFGKVFFENIVFCVFALWPVLSHNFAPLRPTINMRPTKPCLRAGRGGSVGVRAESVTAVFALIVHACACRGWSPKMAETVINHHAKVR